MINDLDHTLAELSPRAVGEFIYHSSKEDLPAEITPFAQINECDNVTSIIPLEQAQKHQLAEGKTVFCHIVLDTPYSTLESTGLTSAVAAQLSSQNIPCNVISGIRHDHLMVPLHRMNETLELLESLRAQAQGWVRAES